MRKILIIEDDEQVAYHIKSELKDVYEVFLASTIHSGKEMLNALSPDLLILDLILPDGNGFDLLREGVKDVPTIILTTMDIDDYHVEGLSLGAVDYLIKPISPVILKKHIEVRLLPEEARYLVSGKLKIDSTKRLVTYDNRQIMLTATEFDILLYLFNNSDSYHTAQEIYEAVYGNMFLQSTTMKMHLSHLRNKLLTAAPGETFISTQYGKGYRFLRE